MEKLYHFLSYNATKLGYSKTTFPLYYFTKETLDCFESNSDSPFFVSIDSSFNISKRYANFI